MYNRAIINNGGEIIMQEAKIKKRKLTCRNRVEIQSKTQGNV